VEILTAGTGKDWVSIVEPPAGDDRAREKAEDLKQRLNQLLTEILLSENLVVLAGLGTTVYIRDAKGNPCAPTMGDLWNEVAAMAGKGFADLKKRVRYVTPKEGDNVELLLSQCQLAQRFEPDQELSTFVGDAETLIVRRCRFVQPDSNLASHEVFLRKVARRNPRKPRLKVFTTNYDLAFETAASHLRFIVVDGFSHTQPQEFDGSHFGYDFVLRSQDREVPDYLPNVFYLYKMHGSVDWELSGPQVTKKEAPPKPLIIYPRMSKFESSYDQPFIELMSRFQLSLREPNTGLLIVGFGMNDHHVVQPIMSAIRANVGLKAAIVSPGLRTETKDSIHAVKSLIQGGDWRLTLVAAKFEEIVSILPDLVKETEAEQHGARLKGLERPR
jgi:SIR2-like domain